MWTFSDGNGGIEHDGPSGLGLNPTIRHTGKQKVFIISIVETAPHLFVCQANAAGILSACLYESHVFGQVEFPLPAAIVEIDFSFAAEIDDGFAVRIFPGDFAVFGKGFEAVGNVVLADQHKIGAAAVEPELLRIGQAVARFLAEKGVELEAGIEVGVFDVDAVEGIGVANFVAVGLSLGFLHGFQHHQAAGCGVVVSEAGELCVEKRLIPESKTDAISGEIETEAGFVESPVDFVRGTVVVGHDAAVDLAQSALFVTIVEVATVDLDGDGVVIEVEESFAFQGAFGDQLVAVGFTGDSAGIDGRRGLGMAVFDRKEEKNKVHCQQAV